MKKTYVLAFLFVFIASFCPAFAAFGDSVDKAIDDTHLKHNSVVSVVVKDVNEGKKVYSRRPDTCLNPASTLKVFTMAAAIDTLGPKYRFETVMYLDKQKNVYLKLGADPLLTTADLDTLIKSLKKAYGGKISHFYIDDTVIDKVYYPDGWMADDLWPNSPKISPYIIDNNTVKVAFSILDNKNIRISQKDDYKFSFINELSVADKTNIVSSLNYGETSGIVSLRGTIAEDLTRDYPVLDTAGFFTQRLRKVLDNNNVSYSKQFYNKKVPSDAKRIASFGRPAGDVVRYILKTSDNFASEVVFKKAGGVWAEYAVKMGIIKAAAGSPGTFENGKLMFEDYYQKAGLNLDKIKLSDASGVSRYNVMTTSWMADALVYLNSDNPGSVKIKDYMITAGEGTLSRRMKNLSGNLRAKTGTIFGVSSLAGYITSLKGEEYAFSIIIQDFGVRSSVIKGLEDDIVDGIYFLD